MVIGHYELKQDKSFAPSTTENLQLSARDYASFTNGKYYFMINPVNRVEQTPRRLMNRQNDVYINRGYTDIDEVTYTIPAGYHLEKEPLNISLDKPFGKFSATMELKGNVLTYKRNFKLIDGTYNKDICTTPRFEVGVRRGHKRAGPRLTMRSTRHRCCRTGSST